MTSVSVDDVETGIACAHRRLAVPAPEIADVFFVHCPGLNRLIAVGNRVRRPHRDFPAVAVRAVVADVDQFDAGQSAVLMNAIGEQLQGGDVFFIPDSRFRCRRNFRGMVYL